MDLKQLNGNMLAFVGDAVLSLQVREYLVGQAFNTGDKLQKASVKYVSAKAQAAFLQYLLEGNYLSEAELLIYKKGRNYKSESAPKNTDIVTYRQASGLEALWGYWYLNQEPKRLKEMFQLFVHYVDKS